MFKPSENSVSTEPSPRSQEYCLDERVSLVRLAHESILSVFSGAEVVKPSNPHLEQPRGVFTTLYLAGDLRGCVGYALPVSPLCQAVVQTARAAAFDDSRFWPVTADEAPRLEVSLSVLSPLFPVLPDQVEVGRHGLVVSLEGRRGLLLPQVPVEANWSRETFLDQTCRKAGLPLNAWRHGAALEAFTAEVFGDVDIRT